jgi:hypothetical protein
MYGGKKKIKYYKGGYDPDTQELSFDISRDIAHVIYEYLVEKKANDENIDMLDYESMIQDKSFNTLLKNASNDEFKHPMSCRQKGWKDTIDIFLNSKRMKFLFNRFKKDVWASREADSLIQALFGKNLISSNPPQRIREEYEKTGKIYKGWGQLDTFQILFKRPKEISTIEYSESDLLIANAVYPKNFVAVVIDKEELDREEKEIPKEFLEIIPSNLPVITRNFEVIRLPEKEKTLIKANPSKTL